MLLALALAFTTSAFAGASGWDYDVAYDPDVSHALDALRWQILRSGDYYHPHRSAKTPDDALRRAGEDGTASILDVTSATSTAVDPKDCPIAAVCRLPDANLLDVFGTTKPTAAMVADKTFRLAMLVPSGSGAWFVVYGDEGPVGLHFTGATGD